MRRHRSAARAGGPRLSRDGRAGNHGRKAASTRVGALGAAAAVILLSACVVPTGTIAPLGNPYWAESAVARGVVATSANSGVVLDGYGTLRAYGAAPVPSGAPDLGEEDIARSLALTSGGQGGYVLDGYGGIHPLGGAPPLTGGPYWSGWDIARGLALAPGGGAYVLDGYGGIHRLGGAPPLTGGPYWSGWDIARGLALAPGGGAYLLDAYGGIHPIGGAPAVTGAPNWPGWDIARDITVLPDGTGGYVLDAYGGLHGFGIGSHSAPVDSTRVGGVWVPSNSAITTGLGTETTPPRSGTAYYGSGSPVAACNGTESPLTVSYPPAPDQDTRCLAWYRPNGWAFPGRRPALIWVHGGGWNRGVAEPLPAPVAAYRDQGWVIVSVQYRFSACGIDQFPTPARDVQDAIAYIRSRASNMGISSSKMVVFGHSSGGQLAALAGTAWNDRSGWLRNGSQYKVAGWVAVSGMEDMEYFSKRSKWYPLARGFIPPAEPGPCEGAVDQDALHAASPNLHLDGADPPGLVIHGSDDTISPAGSAYREMGAAMSAWGRPRAIWFQIVPDGGHTPLWNPVYMDAFLAGAATGVDPTPPS